MQSLAASTNFVLNLEAVGILLGILVSLTVLLGLFITFINKINHLETKVAYLQQELTEHSSLDGHKILAERLTRALDNINRVEKALELHVQDYTNRGDMTQYIIGQTNEKIEHKFGRLYNSMKDMEKFLQKNNNFRIREYFGESEE